MLNFGEVDNKTIIITGGNDGIGFATACALAGEGTEIILVGRDEGKLKNAVKKIRDEKHASHVVYYVADLSSQKSIHLLASQIKSKYDKIDILINNAGCLSNKFGLTEDGLETIIATNYFAHFLLTLLLLDCVKRSKIARIINVSSAIHKDGSIDFESFRSYKKVSFATKIWDILEARLSLKLSFIFMGHFLVKSYAQSKLADVLFTFELAERLRDTHITVNCLHPGFVKTGIGAKGTTGRAVLFWKIISRFAGVSTQVGAETGVYLACSDEVNGISGKYFSNCKIEQLPMLAQCESLQSELWKLSEICCNIVSL
jgi:NAD(P)-dependent dehydrogenase (short-subunit alcohol dehydrogenase family)